MGASRNKVLLAMVVPFLLSSAAKVCADDTGGEDSAAAGDSAELEWFSRVPNSEPKSIEPDSDEALAVELSSTGDALVYASRRRETFRPSREDFNRDKLAVEVRVAEGGAVEAVVFVTDKDGLWFQSLEIFKILPGDWQALEVDLKASSRRLGPVGHQAAWSSLNAATIHTRGVNFFNGQPGAKVEVRKLAASGERLFQELGVVNPNFPAKVRVHDLAEGRFELTREYFNPFDPDEIEVDIEVYTPGLRSITIPAFFAIEYQRRLNANQETGQPLGRPYWAFRFTPKKAGVHKYRIRLTDNSGGETVKVNTPWTDFEVDPSDLPGFVRVSTADHRFFELSTGEFFFPIGFNFHTPKDLRSEQRLKLGHVPNRGTYTYEDYFAAMAVNGVNAAEIWMAAWSFAIEWTSARQGYHGLGRYNLFNAWRLDQIMDSARDNGIYINFVLDNHGKLSSHCDPEWDNSPHNKHTPFAAADGAMLDKPIDFFSDAEAKRYYRNRNRYIAARWGAYPNIIGFELWSELDLITDQRKIYDSGLSMEWHREMARQLIDLTDGNIMVTTHVCGDYNNVHRHRKLYEIDEIAYVPGDGYRNNPPIVEYMRNHTDKIKDIGKPIMITEYGGNPQAADNQRLEADLHGGIWSAFFMEQAATPFLWWHQFIHLNDNYHHFRGFAEFFRGVDPRGKNFEFGKLPVKLADGAVDGALDALKAGNPSELHGWIYRISAMDQYPEDREELDELSDRRLTIAGMEPGRFRVDFLDTYTGALVASRAVNFDSSPIEVIVPPFKLDIAFKVLSEEE